ncbi:MAG: acyl-CoA dehydrogenase, partial [Mycobacterium sp.]
HGLGHLHRYVVTEELLAAGAPVAAHWIADRQVGPGLLSYGTEEQKRRILPEIAAGRFFSAIGMSEPQAGSDLAAAAAKATRTDGGWLLSGTKVWTSGAHLAHQVVVLARTSPVDPQRRHAGFSQFLVPMDSPGISISPIVLMTGEHHFNEITFDETFIADANLLGTEGDGWRQVTAELSFERSGPERILTTAPLLIALTRALASRDDVSDHTAAALGDLLARLASLRQMSISVARALTAGRPQPNEAALVKDLGTRFEQESADLAAELLCYVGDDVEGRDRVAELVEVARAHAPLFTLRGGTNEVLRGMVAKGMGLR